MPSADVDTAHRDIEKMKERLAPELPPSEEIATLLDRLADVLNNQGSEIDGLQAELNATTGELEDAQAKLEDSDTSAAALVRRLHDHFGHRGPVFLCRDRVCDEAVSFLHAEGVPVR